MTRWPAETPAERATWGLPPPTAETCPEATERRPRGAFFVAANRLRDPRPLWLFRIPNPESQIPNPQSPPSNAQHHPPRRQPRSEEHTSELQSLMRISYAVFCLKKKTT